MDFLEQEVNEGRLAGIAKNSLLTKWKPALDVNSKEYIEETTELEEDRTESVYFRK